MVSLTRISPPSEGVLHAQTDITAVWNDEALGPGTLLVAETRVSWFDGSGMGFTLDYPSISLHAISRDLTAYPKEHLYVMVNAQPKESGGEKKDDIEEDEGEEDESSDDDDDEDDLGGHVTEIRFVPSDKSSLESMFSAMTECQALHPDPQDSDSDYEGDEYDVEEAEQGQMDLLSSLGPEQSRSQLDRASPEEGLEEGPPDQRRSPRQRCMGGVRAQDPALPGCNGTAEEGGVAPTAPDVSGQFEDADPW